MVFPFLFASLRWRFPAIVKRCGSTLISRSFAVKLGTSARSVATALVSMLRSRKDRAISSTNNSP